MISTEGDSHSDFHVGITANAIISTRVHRVLRRQKNFVTCNKSVVVGVVFEGESDDGLFVVNIRMSRYLTGGGRCFHFCELISCQHSLKRGTRLPVELNAHCLREGLIRKTVTAWNGNGNGTQPLSEVYLWRENLIKIQSERNKIRARHLSQCYLIGALPKKTF